MTKFSEWVSSIAEAGRELVPRKNRQDKSQNLYSLCQELCSSKGEAMGTAIAHDVVKAYMNLGESERVDFFYMLLTEFSPDPADILRCAEAFKLKSDRANYKALSNAIAAPRLHLFRSINMAPQGTATLIHMRRDLLSVLGDYPQFVGIDEDLKHLLISWFNRGFLTLEQICWRTPAHILEKLIAYEAVHEMSGWDDLRRRLADDRRCFAFFHPALEDEPLIFVEVALVKGMAGNVQELLAKPGAASPQVKSKSSSAVKLIKPLSSDQEDFDTAIFYSISNCQEGLKGISFGNFLIKQVVLELRHEFEQLKRFATLSPIPGFRRWLNTELKQSDLSLISEEERTHLEILQHKEWHKDQESCDILQPLLTRLCAHYLANAKKGTEPLDPVARFHLGNGAQIARLNWLGDTSANGIKQSAGLLVNYVYKLKMVEQNHEAYVNNGEIAMSAEIQKLL
ncbi:malonyl-CoA decarboxylase [Zhongshania sp.]|uniref:malonyl-CoA decarboxylase n=1 Tax=Zhongshania sp. TaxID=1971902 RepID=UPI003562D2C8